MTWPPALVDQPWPVTPLAAGSAEALVVHHDVVLFDLDGVLYAGPSALPGAPEAVTAVRDAGLGVAFVTNNASRTPAVVADHLTSLGIVAGPGDVVTSAQAAAKLVAETVSPGAAVLVVGGEGLNAALRERGLRPVASAEDAPVAVVQGFSPEVGWRLLAEGTYAVRAGLPWVASNLDVTVPTDRGLAPGNGTLVSVIAQATGRRPVVAGKPETPLHLEAVSRTAAAAPLVVGDRLDTDVEGANRAGVPSLLVLTGVTGPSDLVLAGPGQRPTYVAEDLETGLLRPHPPVHREGEDLWRCGGWRCALGDGRIDLTGEGVSVDAVRAVCVGVWDSDMPGVAESALVALAQLKG